MPTILSLSWFPYKWRCSAILLTPEVEVGSIEAGSNDVTEKNRITVTSLKWLFLRTHKVASRTLNPRLSSGLVTAFSAMASTSNLRCFTCFSLRTNTQRSWPVEHHSLKGSKNKTWGFSGHPSQK